MHLVQGTPNLYLHREGLLQEAGRWVKAYGSKVQIVTGTKSWAAVDQTLTNSLLEHMVDFTVQRYAGDCTHSEIERIVKAMDSSTELVMGVGGGKVLDVAKAVAATKGLPFVAVPTLASTCSPTTPVSVIYSEKGVFVESPVWSKNSILTLVDTNVIANAPLNFLLSGIGDTVAKWYEGRVNAEGKPDVPTKAALSSAKLCKDILFDHAEMAVLSLRNKQSSDELKYVVDAIFLAAGMVGGLGGANCRAAVAHSFHNGITAIPETKKVTHGEKVAYGILLQLAIEERADELAELIAFYAKCGLPTSIRKLNVDLNSVPSGLLREVLDKALSDEAMSTYPINVTRESLDKAIQFIENLASQKEFV